MCVCVCVCVWFVVVTVQKKEVDPNHCPDKAAVAWDVWCSGQFFISLACMDPSRMLLSQQVCPGIPCELREIWSQGSISAWSVECVTLIIRFLSWRCSEAAQEPGHWAHSQIHLVLILSHLMSQNIFLETFYFIYLFFTYSRSPVSTLTILRIDQKSVSCSHCGDIHEYTWSVIICLIGAHKYFQCDGVDGRFYWSFWFPATLNPKLWPVNNIQK